MAKIEKISYKDIKSRFDNRTFLQEAFSTIKNASLVKNNDSELIMLDEENDLFYKASYKIDYDLKEVFFENVAPVVVTEDSLDVKSLFEHMMDSDVKEDEAVGIGKKLARFFTKNYVGGEKAKLIREARSNSLNKKIDKGRKEVLEEMQLFKSENFLPLNDVKYKFYDRFIDTLNKKYLSEDATVNVVDRLNFSFATKKNQYSENGPIYKKKLSLKESFIEKVDTFYNPVEILKNSPTFYSKLNKFITNFYRSENKGLEEAKKAFVNFATNWPVMFLITEANHKEFAIKHFSSKVEDKKKAKALVDIYNSLIESEEFAEKQEAYLKENYNFSLEDIEKIEKKKNFYQSNYNAKIVDDVRVAVSELRESVQKIESKNVANYLKYAETQLDEMLRTGKFSEDLFERLVVDIFGDRRVAITDESDNLFEDPDFASKDQNEVFEEKAEDFRLEAKASALVIRLRESISNADKATAMALEEELELVKSMLAINAIDEGKLDSIIKILDEAREKEEQERLEENVQVKDDKESVFCPSCFTEIENLVTEAISSGKDEVVCPNCSEVVEV